MWKFVYVLFTHRLGVSISFSSFHFFIHWREFCNYPLSWFNSIWALKAIVICFDHHRSCNLFKNRIYLHFDLISMLRSILFCSMFLPLIYISFICLLYSLSLFNFFGVQWPQLKYVSFILFIFSIMLLLETVNSFMLMIICYIAVLQIFYVRPQLCVLIITPSLKHRQCIVIVVGDSEYRCIFKILFEDYLNVKWRNEKDP